MNLLFVIIYVTSVLYLGSNADNDVTTNPAERNSNASGVGQPITLEGNCVVVCDASTVSRTSSNIQPFIAFSVTQSTELTPSDITFGGQDRPVITFNQVLCNIGSAFDSTLSAFFAPTSGYYQIQFQVYRHHNRRAVHVALTVSKHCHYFLFVIHLKRSISNL